MKKSILLLLCAIMTLSFAACSTDQEPEIPGTPEVSSTPKVSSTPTIPETSISDFTYSKVQNGITIDKYLGEEDSITIPAKIGNDSVVAFLWKKFAFQKT